jgi:hypothetical protein
MFRPLLAIIRSHSQHYRETTLHLLLLSIDYYYSVTEVLLMNTETKAK